MTKNGLRTFDARAAVVALEASDARRPREPRRAPSARDRSPRVRYCDWSYGTSHRPSDPTTSWPDSASIGDLAPPATPAVTRLAQGPLDEAAGTVSDPLAPDRDDVGA